MRVTVLVCTFGLPIWADLGDQAANETGLNGALSAPYEMIRLHLPDATLAEVRNEAARTATSDWLCFLDGDDRLAPGYLDAMRRADHAPPALLVPAVQYLNHRGRPVGEARIPAWGIDPIHVTNCAVIGTLVPRQLFLQVGGFPEDPIYEDWALWLACIRAGAELVPVPAAVYWAATRLGSRNQQQDGRTVSETYWKRRQEHEAWLAGRA